MFFQIQSGFGGIPCKLILERFFHLGMIPQNTPPAKRLCRELPLMLPRVYRYSNSLFDWPTLEGVPDQDDVIL